MYSFLEIQFIFRNCLNWDELERACQSFLFVMADGDLTIQHSQYISEQSTKRFRELENL